MTVFIKSLHVAEHYEGITPFSEDAKSLLWVWVLQNFDTYFIGLKKL